MSQLSRAAAIIVVAVSLCVGVAGAAQTESRSARVQPSLEQQARPEATKLRLARLTPKQRHAFLQYTRHRAAAERRAFRRWIIGIYFRKWIAGLPKYDPLQCGGSLPPCYVMWRESGGNPLAENPISTASGKWQFLDTTWNGYGGYSHASHAPVQVQDAKARELWAGGAGASHWACC